ncbi:MAG: hypothetical protein IKP73_05490 [Bacteroidales bacterium]|nr:hypothetical protein [Bacteroidales bacterium]MBR4625430.1 hypothetical protein [Alphaproteobacteria bacterium]
MFGRLGMIGRDCWGTGVPCPRCGSKRLPFDDDDYYECPVCGNKFFSSFKSSYDEDRTYKDESDDIKSDGW